MMRFSALLTAGLAVLDSAYAVQSEDNSLSTTSSLFAHPSHAHHSSSSYSLMHVHNNSTKTSIKSSQTPHLVVRPTITKDQPHTKQTSAMDKTSRTTTKPFSTHSTHTQLGTSSRISETATGPVHTSTHAHPDPSSTNPKTNTTFSTKPNTKTKTHNTKSTDTPTHKTNTSRKTSKDETTLTGDKKTHTTHHASHSEHTHAPAYLTAPFVVHSITVPAQTAVETGDFSTRTLSDHTGPPNSYSATTVTGNDHHPTILPVWFNKKGHAIVVNPVKVDGPHGIIPPPEGLPKLNIGPDGNPTPDPSNDDPPKTSDPNTTKTHDKTSKKTHDHTTKTHDKTTSKKTSEKTSSTSSKTTSTSSATTTTSTSSKTTSTSSATTTTSTSTPTGKSTQYLILPKKDSTEKQHNQITSKLIDMAGKSKVNTKDYKMDGLGFWTATLNSTQVDEIKKESIVEGVVKDEIMTVKGIEEDDKKTKRTDGIESFRNLVRSAKFWKRDNPERQHAPLELALISQPKDNSISKDVWGKTYQYDESAGKGITVYVVDTGASPQNNEYKKMPGKKSWIYAGALGAKDHDTDKDDKFGHGTCVLSKVAGPKYGVSKNVDIVVIKMQAERPKDANGNQVFAIHGSTYLSAIQSIIYDIKSNKRQGKAVINMSFGLPIANMFFAQYVESVTKEITGLDVPIIVAAGNEASSGRKEVDTYPALWAKKNDGIIVVGSTGDNNHISSFSQDGPLVTVYAPGDGIVCAAPGDGDAEQHQQGTSFAAPAVAGLTAYLMALPSNNLPAVGNGKIPGQLRGQLKDHASWARVNGGPKIIWNGQDTKTSWDNQDCDSDGSILKRRGGSPKCSASVSTGTKTSTATNTASKSTTHSTTKVTKTSHSTTKGTTTSHHTTTAKTTHATTTSSKTSATKSSTKSTPASLWCAPTHKASATIPADKAHDKVESFCKAMLKQEGSINGFYPMSHDYKKYAKTYKLGNVDTTFNLNWVSGRQAGINVKMCEDMLSEVIDDCSGGYGGGIPHDGIPTGVASFNVTLGKDD